MTRQELHTERKRAEQLVAERRYAEAADVYRGVLAQDDSHAKAWYGIGYCYYKLGNLDQSRLSLREARRRGYQPADAMLRRIHDRIAAGVDTPALTTPPPIVTPMPASGSRQVCGGKMGAALGAKGEADVVLAQAVRRLAARKEALRKQLDDLCLALAPKAEMLDVAAEWPQTVALRQARTALETAERQLKERRKLLRQAREAYQKKKAYRRERIDRFKEAVAPFEAAVQAAEEKNAAIKEEIAAAEEGIRAAVKAGTGVATRRDSPIARFEDARAGASLSLAAATRELEDAIAARAEKAEKVEAEQRAWREERERLKQNLEDIQAGCLHAEKQAEAARVAYRDALSHLGRFALAASERLPQLAEYFVEGEHLLRAIAEVESELDEKRGKWEREGSAASH